MQRHGRAVHAEVRSLRLDLRERQRPPQRRVPAEAQAAGPSGGVDQLAEHVRGPLRPEDLQGCQVRDQARGGVHGVRHLPGLPLDLRERPGRHRRRRPEHLPGALQRRGLRATLLQPRVTRPRHDHVERLQPRLQEPSPPLEGQPRQLRPGSRPGDAVRKVSRRPAQQVQVDPRPRPGCRKQSHPALQNVVEVLARTSARFVGFHRGERHQLPADRQARPAVRQPAPVGNLLVQGRGVLVAAPGRRQVLRHHTATSTVGGRAAVLPGS